MPLQLCTQGHSYSCSLSGYLEVHRLLLFILGTKRCSWFMTFKGWGKGCKGNLTMENIIFLNKSGKNRRQRRKEDEMPLTLFYCSVTVIIHSERMTSAFSVKRNRSGTSTCQHWGTVVDWDLLYFLSDSRAVQVSWFKSCLLSQEIVSCSEVYCNKVHSPRGWYCWLHESLYKLAVLTQAPWFIYAIT